MSAELGKRNVAEPRALGEAGAAEGPEFQSAAGEARQHSTESADDEPGASDAAATENSEFQFTTATESGPDSGEEVRPTTGGCDADLLIDIS